MDNEEKNAKKINPLVKYLIIVGAAVLLLIIALLVIFSGSGKVNIDIETSLKEVILASNFNTATYKYNSIVEVKDGEKTKYYVAYKGTVTAGFNFENVSIVREGNTIKIVVPDITIQSVTIDTDMEYIFVKEKYNKETTYAEAYAACEQDLTKKANENQTLLRTARQGAENVLLGLVKPFESQLADGETFEIVFETSKEVTE